jgi:hypothetical protein
MATQALTAAASMVKPSLQMGRWRWRAATDDWAACATCGLAVDVFFFVVASVLLDLVVLDQDCRQTATTEALAGAWFAVGFLTLAFHVGLLLLGCCYPLAQPASMALFKALLLPALLCEVLQLGTVGYAIDVLAEDKLECKHGPRLADQAEDLTLAAIVAASVFGFLRLLHLIYIARLSCCCCYSAIDPEEEEPVGGMLPPPPDPSRVHPSLSLSSDFHTCGWWTAACVILSRFVHG